MAVKDIFKVTRKTFFNPAAWVDVDGIAYQHQTIMGILKSMFTRTAPGVTETFDEAMKRQGLTEKDIKDGIATYRAMSVVFTLFGVALIAYAMYLLIHHVSVLGCILAFAASALFLAYAFQYDFWAMQMRERKLGLTYSDWKRYYFGG